MQARLEKWRKDVSDGSKPKTLPSSPGNYVARQGDYGDDIRDFEAKQDRMWMRELDYLDWRRR